MKAHSDMNASSDRQKSQKRCLEKETAGHARASEISKRWTWHFRRLSHLRDRLIDELTTDLTEIAEPIEPHSLHEADSATDEFDRGMALSQLSSTQDALYEVEAAMNRIQDGTYGRCEQTGVRINPERLKAVPWTRFCAAAEAELEKRGEHASRHLGVLRSIQPPPDQPDGDREET
jgi:RNA polymerase-binding transcription factor DksA